MPKRRAGHEHVPERLADATLLPRNDDPAQGGGVPVAGQVVENGDRPIRRERREWTVRCVPLPDSFSDTGILVIRKGGSRKNTAGGMKRFNDERGISSFGAAENVIRRGRRDREISEVEGLRLGAKPFIAAMNLYLESREGLIMPSTLMEEEKKLRYIGNLLQDLKKAGRVGSTDPRRIDRGDIQALRACTNRSVWTPARRRNTISF